MKYEWELVCSAFKNDTSRLRVFNGWIVRSLTYEKATGESAKATCESMVFILDPHHYWEIEKISKQESKEEYWKTDIATNNI